VTVDSRGEVSDFINRSTEVVVTDLKMIAQLLRQARSAVTGGFIFGDVRYLRIISRFSIRLLKEIESMSRHAVFLDAHPTALLSKEAIAEVHAWLQLSSNLSHLSGLRRLRIWLDCDDSLPWAREKEEPFLHVLKPLDQMSKLNCCIEVPRHVYDYKPAKSSLRIRRRIRQRHFGYYDWNARLHVLSRGDFPILEAGQPPFENVTQASLEEIERQLVDGGVDVEEQFIDDSLIDEGMWVCKDGIDLSPWASFLM